MEHFIGHKMKMTHIYQPLLIKTLLLSGNSATAENIARGFLNEDKAQLEYYVQIAKRWPLQTLRKHKVVDYTRNGSTFTLLLDNITKEQRERLVEICDSRYQEYVDKMRRLPWFDRRGFREHIPGQTRFDVLAKSKGVCVACGVSSLERALEIDHIVPVSMGGTNELSNFQALCYKCNAQKKNRDDTDFVMVLNRLKYRNPKCPFCISRDPVFDNRMAFALRNAKPVAHLHSLVLPRRHTGNFFDLIPAEKSLCLTLIDSVKSDIQERDSTVTGFTVRFETGQMAGSMAEHCQIHVIPNRRGKA